MTFSLTLKEFPSGSTLPFTQDFLWREQYETYRYEMMGTSSPEAQALIEEHAQEFLFTWLLRCIPQPSRMRQIVQTHEVFHGSISTYTGSLPADSVVLPLLQDPTLPEHLADLEVVSFVERLSSEMEKPHGVDICYTMITQMFPDVFEEKEKHLLNRAMDQWKNKEYNSSQSLTFDVVEAMISRMARQHDTSVDQSRSHASRWMSPLDVSLDALRQHHIVQKDREASDILDYLRHVIFVDKNTKASIPVWGKDVRLRSAAGFHLVFLLVMMHLLLK